MKRIINVPQLENIDGEPYRQSENGPIATLAWAVKLMVGTLPQGNLVMADMEHGAAVIAACRKADAELSENGASVIEIEDEHYKWLIKILFDDAEGQRLSQNLKGALAINMFNAWMAMAVKTALEHTIPAGHTLSLVEPKESV